MFTIVQNISLQIRETHKLPSSTIANGTVYQSRPSVSLYMCVGTVMTKNANILEWKIVVGREGKEKHHVFWEMNFSCMVFRKEKKKDYS